MKQKNTCHLEKSSCHLICLFLYLILLKLTELNNTTEHIKLNPSASLRLTADRGGVKSTGSGGGKGRGILDVKVHRLNVTFHCHDHGTRSRCFCPSVWLQRQHDKLHLTYSLYYYYKCKSVK